MPTPEEHLSRRAVHDFDRGLDEAIALIRARHSPATAAPLVGFLRSAVALFRVRAELAHEVERFLALGRRRAEGEPADALAKEGVAALLKRKRVHLFARTHHPAYAAVVRELEGMLERRLPDLARLASVRDAPAFDELVRRAFPDPARIEELVTENAAAMLRVVATIETTPEVVRVPRALVLRGVATAREFVPREVEYVRGVVREVYGDRAASS